MKALVWHGTRDIRCEQVPDPRIEEPGDVILKMTACSICGTDLHLYNGFIPAMRSGDVIGHEFMGEVVEVGRDCRDVKVGQRVVVPYFVFCGTCDQCRLGNFAYCQTSNRNKHLAETAFGHPVAGFFGFSEVEGSYQGGQAEYVRVPNADRMHIKIPDGLPDEKVVFVGDTLSTGWQAALQCDIQPTDTVAIWGLGAVGQFALRSAMLMRARQVVAIDQVQARLDLAREAGAATINFREESVVERLNELTGGKGPEKCIDAVGMEADPASSVDAIYDRAKQAVLAETDRSHVLREMIYVCRPAGTISIPGVYGGLVDKLPFGAFMNKGLTIRSGLAQVPRWANDLMRRIQEGQIDPSVIVTHTRSLDDGPEMYRTYNDKGDGCVRVVLKP
jgi:threonine dehydrogenase-like Zn-dependent dehydrogenase